MEPNEQPLAQLVDLTGKTAIVTGAAVGLGYEIANRLGEAGASVVLNDLDPSRLEEAAKRLGEAGRTVTAVAGDHSKREDVERMLATALDAYGRVDILVNNAGIYPTAPFLEAGEDLWRKIFEVNLVGPYLCTQLFARQVIEQGGGGSIVNISSMSAVVPHGDPLTAYAASKAGLLNTTKVLAKSLAPHGIRVNAVLPGGMDTPGVAAGSGGRAPETIPLGRRAHPDEVARGVLFLASGLADYVTGVSLLVDGGVAVL
jgi:2-deoxy-D-gluconate 3-dehydrogenase